jgi:nucleotide-binding universal stress UspA family protein
MVATDGSEGASRAVEVAAELAKVLACDLLIVTVADRLLAGEVRQLAHTEIRPGDILECLTAQTLKAAEACARRLGVQQIEVRTSWGDVTKSLLDIAALAVERRRIAFLKIQDHAKCGSEWSN